jgi:hypothetical protein
MELPKHSCISCAYLCEDADRYIPISGREQAIDAKKWNNQWINYQKCVCYKGNIRNYYSSGMTPKQIRDEVIQQNSCKHLTRTHGISPIATDQRQSSKWAKRAFWIAFASLVAVLTTWLANHFIFD